MNAIVRPGISNYILLGDPSRQQEKVESLVQELARRNPAQFAARNLSFDFELRYVPPFDRGFTELRRLQGTAAEQAGFRDEFRGCIVMNLSAYLGKESEDYFIRSMKFLYDMADCWKYIFLVDNSSERAAQDLVRTMLEILDDIPCSVQVMPREQAQPGSRQVKELCTRHGVTCSLPTRRFLQSVLTDFSERHADAILRELAAGIHPGTVVSLEHINNHLHSESPVIRYMLTAKQFAQLTALLQEQIQEVELGKAV